jgi:hypothetical protein
VYLEEPPTPIQKKNKPFKLTKNQEKKQFRKAVQGLAEETKVHHKRKKSRKFKKRLLWHQAKEEIKWLDNQENKDSK